MVFSSMIFLWIFLPLTLIVYYALQLLTRAAGKDGQTLQNIWLLLMSVLFYSWGEPRYIVLLICSILLNFAGGMGIHFAGENLKTKKAVLAVCVCLNLLLLGYFKYYNFAAGLLNGLTGTETLPVKNIVLPIGISFYTFQAMSYVIDLYRGKTRVQKSFYKLALYITFFPQLIAGPIVRYRDIAEQIDQRTLSVEKFTSGVQRFVLGLAKKVLIANTMAKGADLIFDMDFTYLNTTLAWAGIILYALQIYYDFSGYSDMAIGLGRMFGFEFLENFNLPYISASVREFWRRWHISLSTWFKEYLYIPLGGNRKGNMRTYLNLLIVFFATGLWHGAGETFVVWGLFHGLFLVLERIFLGKLLDKNPIRPLNHIYTLLIVLIGWVFFRADTLPQAGEYITAMFCPRYPLQYTLTELFGRRCLVTALFGILFAGVLPAGLMKRASDNAVFRLLYVPVLLFFCIILLASDAYNPFIYFRF
ncbi:MAG: MBOAT family protein [Eubacteriales bacterium]|nr:MBOAT family protein [Eubacteriales bacterium]